MRDRRHLLREVLDDLLERAQFDEGLADGVHFRDAGVDLVLDRIVEMEGFRRAVGVKNVTVNEPYFQGHYPDQPIMPGVMIVEAMAQLGGLLLLRKLEVAGRVPVLLSIDRVKSQDNQWIPLRYTVTRKSGQSHAVSTGILTAGVAVVFWPAAPVFLLRKGADITINRGTAFDVFTDANHMTGVTTAPAGNTLAASIAPPNPSPASPSGAATVSITCPVASAEIEVDGAFVGNAPATLQLATGTHRIVVRHGPKSWQRTLQVNAGSTLSLNATL